MLKLREHAVDLALLPVPLYCQKGRSAQDIVQIAIRRLRGELDGEPKGCELFSCPSKLSSLKVSAGIFLALDSK